MSETEAMRVKSFVKLFNERGSNPILKIHFGSLKIITAILVDLIDKYPPSERNVDEWMER